MLNPGKSADNDNVRHSGPPHVRLTEYLKTHTHTHALAKMTENKSHSFYTCIKMFINVLVILVG